MEKEQDGILIEMYLDGVLEGEELKSFEERLQVEKELSATFEEHQQMRTFLQHRESRNQLKKNISKISATTVDEKSATIRPIYSRPWFRVASIAAAAALILFIMQPWQQGDIYNQYAIHKTLSLSERGASELDISKTEIDFNSKKYIEALPSLEKYVETYPENSQAKLFLGICYLETNNFEKANAIFSNLASGQTSFQNDGQWYLALLAIKQKDNNTAKKYLESISSDSSYFDKAQKILSKIK